MALALRAVPLRRPWPAPRVNAVTPAGYTVAAWQLSDGGRAAGAPATDGCLVVWADDRSGDLDVYAYDLETEEESSVRIAPGDQTDPVVACGQVYWVDRSGSAPVVWTLDPESDEAVPVSGAGADQVAAGERWVVWSEATPRGATSSRSTARAAPRSSSAPPGATRSTRPRPTD